MLHTHAALFTPYIALAAPPAGGASANPIVAFLPLVLMFLIFYFLLIRPQQRRQKEHKLMLQALKKGDRVVTNGGIIGTVAWVKDDEVVLKVGEGEVKIEVLKSAIASVRTKE